MNREQLYQEKLHLKTPAPTPKPNEKPKKTPASTKTAQSGKNQDSD